MLFICTQDSGASQLGARRRRRKICDRGSAPSKGERLNAALCGRMPCFTVFSVTRLTMTEGGRCALDIPQRIPAAMKQVQQRSAGLMKQMDSHE
jgi:hypothetical protein